MKNSHLLLVSLAVALGTAALGGQTSSASLLVLAKNDQTMAVVDPGTLKIVWSVPAGPDPHEVIASTDGTVAYIANYGRGTYNTLTPVDLVNRQAQPAVHLGVLRGPHGLAFAGGKVWFTTETAKALASYDPAAKQIDSIIGLGQNRTHMLIVSGDLQRLIASNVNSATISIVERTAGRAGGPGGGRGGAQPAPARGPAAAPQGDWNQTVVAVGNGVEGFDLSPNGKEIWTGNSQDGTVSIIDVATKKVTETLAANVTGANRLKFTPDGTRVFLSMLNNPDVVVFDAASRKEVKRVAVGRGAAGILMQPDGSRAYVACSPDNYVAVIDVNTLQVVGRIETGRGPDGLAWAVRR